MKERIHYHQLKEWFLDRLFSRVKIEQQVTKIETEERITYHELKRWFLDDAYRWCQQKFENGKIIKWNEYFNEWGGALDTYSESFDSVIENLMIDVIFIITNGARHILSHQIVFVRIQETLRQHDLNELIKDLDDEEKRDFLYDLDLILNNREIE